MEQTEYYSGYGAWSRRNTTVDMDHGPDGILQWAWSRRNTTVGMEQTEYYSGYGADGILQWIWSRRFTALDMEQSDHFKGVNRQNTAVIMGQAGRSNPHISV